MNRDSTSRGGKKEQLHATCNHDDGGPSICRAPLLACVVCHSSCLVRGSRTTMPRGKNYVNNNKGMFLAAKKGTVMEPCFYGSGCTRPDCIYRHDGPNKKEMKKSADPCMAYLAGDCAFHAQSCRKRHPSKDECQRLVAKYRATPCRYGDECLTKGCLYIHPSDDEPPMRMVQPPAVLAQQQPPVLSSWRPAPLLRPTAPTASSSSSSSWKPNPPPSRTMTPLNASLNINAKEFVPGG